jgi:hydroxysqualene dehydroxylase
LAKYPQACALTFLAQIALYVECAVRGMKETPRIHIVGTGLAGLSTALHLAQATTNLALYEAAGHAGGRCRSYFDRELGARIDNGNHLVLSGNVILRDYLMLADAEETLVDADEPVFDFFDLRRGENWSLNLGRGIIPWWLFSKRRRIPETQLSDYLTVLRVMRAKPHETVAELTKASGALYEKFWEPLCLAVLNTTPEEGSARLLGNVLAQSFALGGHACRPLFPREGMSETFVDPCLRQLQSLGIAPHYNCRLQSLDFVHDRVRALRFADQEIVLGPRDWVILAVPAWVAKELLPDLTAPVQFNSIINAHFRFRHPDPRPRFLGILGGIAEWVFVRPDILSVTVSAAERYRDWQGDRLITAIWEDIARALGLDAAQIPPHRLIKEKRATFAATPAQDALRPKAKVNWSNLLLAGDWTANELPSTIEGSVRTGLRAAQIVSRWLDLG